MSAAVSLSHLSVCGGGGELFGLICGVDGAPGRFQVCGYRACVYRGAAWHRPAGRFPQTGGRYPTEVELCYCCAAVPLPSGHKWSLFFCDACHGRVVAINRSCAFAAIPIGRHSIMNGVALSGDDANCPRAVEAFGASTSSLWNRIHRLECWRRGVVRDYLDAMPGVATPFAPLLDYLAHVNAQGAPRAEMFRQLTRYFGVELTSDRRN